MAINKDIGWLVLVCHNGRHDGLGMRGPRVGRSSSLAGDHGGTWGRHLLELRALLHVLRPMGLLTLLIAVVCIPTAVVLSLLRAIAALLREKALYLYEEELYEALYVVLYEVLYEVLYAALY